VGVARAGYSWSSIVSSFLMFCVICGRYPVDVKEILGANGIENLRKPKWNGENPEKTGKKS
jgi:hypothetical protein